MAGLTKDQIAALVGAEGPRVPAVFRREGYECTSASRGFEIRDEYSFSLIEMTSETLIDLIKVGIEFRIRAFLQSQAEGQADAEKKFSEIVAKIQAGQAGDRGANTVSVATAAKQNPLREVIRDMYKKEIPARALKKLGLSKAPKTTDKEGQKAFQQAQIEILVSLEQIPAIQEKARAEKARRDALVTESQDELDDLLGDL